MSLTPKGPTIPSSANFSSLIMGGNIPLNLNGSKITNLSTPTENSDAATKLYVDTHTGPGSGDVVGPVSSLPDSLVRFNGLTGKLIKDSNVTLADDGTMTVPTGFFTYLTTNNLSSVNKLSFFGVPPVGQQNCYDLPTVIQLLKDYGLSS